VLRQFSFVTQQRSHLEMSETMRSRQIDKDLSLSGVSAIKEIGRE
jgi:hypothetical protein